MITSFLVLVLAGFATFMVALGAVWARQFAAEVRTERVTLWAWDLRHLEAWIEIDRIEVAHQRCMAESVDLLGVCAGHGAGKAVRIGVSNDDGVLHDEPPFEEDALVP